MKPEEFKRIPADKAAEWIRNDQNMTAKGAELTPQGRRFRLEATDAQVEQARGEMTRELRVLQRMEHIAADVMRTTSDAKLKKEEKLSRLKNLETELKTATQEYAQL